MTNIIGHAFCCGVSAPPASILAALRRGFPLRCGRCGTMAVLRPLRYAVHAGIRARATSAANQVGATPTLAEMPDGRILVVMRAEGGHKW